MSNRQPNGGIIGKTNNVNLSAGASGVFSVAEAYNYQRRGLWPAAQLPSPFLIERSLRFRSGSSAYLTRTVANSSSSSWTWSGWVKKSGQAVDTALFSGYKPSTPTQVYFTSADVIRWYEAGADFSTTAVYRDPSAWYHVVCSRNGTSTLTMYVNGVQVAQTSTSIPAASPMTTGDSIITLGAVKAIPGGGTTFYYEGYMTEVNFVDGQALTPSAFGEFDALTNAWVPKKYLGGYGTNGFYLNFSNVTANSATALGADTGMIDISTQTVGHTAANNFTPNNFSLKNDVTCDTVVDVPTNWGIPGILRETPLRSYINKSNPNLTVAGNGLAFTGAFASIHRMVITKRELISGKYYWEVTPGIDASSIHLFGIAPLSASVADTNYVGTSDYGCAWGVQAGTGIVTGNGFSINGSFPAPAAATPIGFAYDATGKKLWVRTSTGWLTGSPDTDTIPSFYSTKPDMIGMAPAASIYNNNSLTTVFNFGPNYAYAKPTGYSDVFDVSTSPRGNYATLNPINYVRSTILDGGLRTNAGDRGSVSTIGMLSGKWYCEMTVVTLGSESSIGLSRGQNIMNPYVGAATDSWGYYYSGLRYTGGVSNTYGASYTAGDVIGCAFDADAGNLVFYKNGVSQGTAYSSLSTGPYYFATSGRTSTVANNVYINFGQYPFKYQPPAGHNPLCTHLIATPAIQKAPLYFDTQIYTGNGTTQVVSNSAFAPDLVWIKSRTQALGHAWHDTVRGSSVALVSNSTAAESVSSFIDAFTGNGVTLRNTISGNNSSDRYVAWMWNAGSNTVTNTDGSITSTVRANPQAGFSIVSYTGTGANATVGHGLGVAPKMFIVKNRSASATNWCVYHSSMTSAAYSLLLDKTDAQASYPTVWNSLAPTSSVFNIGTNLSSNGSSNSMIAYCFAEIEGYSKFGSYTGNGLADGPFVWCGFRPKFLLIKNISAGSQWEIIDSTRDTYNPAGYELYPNSFSVESNAASSGGDFDFLAGGFKSRRATTELNSSGATHIFAAFAEVPFKYANAR